jgi:hypothetical protein
MFARIATFGTMSPARDAVAFSHSNDNKINARSVVALRRSGRAMLACHWRLNSAGRLECHWDFEIADRAATEEPDQPWTIGRLYRLFGMRTGGGRLALRCWDERET